MKISTIYLSLFLVFSQLCLSAKKAWVLPLSRGDIIQISIPEDEYFVGFYRVNQDGEIEVPYVGNVAVAGQDTQDVQFQLSRILIDRGYFLEGQLPLSVDVIQWGAINVNISGQVFQPGRKLINENKQSEKDNQLTATEQIKGDTPIGRYLTDALRIAGGVLPTADLSRIKIIRDGQTSIHDLSGVMTGKAYQDQVLLDGDEIIIPRSDKYQPELVRPTQITPPGIKIFVSNLTIPATNNASSAINNTDEGISVPYGSRFSHAVIATNCVGGTKSVNAQRKAILVRANSISGETIYLEKDIESLLRDANNNDENPLLMPLDGVACYDSSVSNARDIFRTISDFLSPLNPILILRQLFQ